VETELEVREAYRAQSAGSAAAHEDQGTNSSTIASSMLIVAWSLISHHVQIFFHFPELFTVCFMFQTDLVL
jgi:hypothetical protein